MLEDARQVDRTAEVERELDFVRAARGVRKVEIEACMTFVGFIQIDVEMLHEAIEAQAAHADVPNAVAQEQLTQMARTAKGVGVDGAHVIGNPHALDAVGVHDDMRTALVMALDEQPGDGIETFVFLISPDIRERGSDVAVMGTVRHERGIA